MYGFMDITLGRKEIKIEAISHGGQVRSSTTIRQRPACESWDLDLNRCGDSDGGRQALDSESVATSHSGNRAMTSGVVRLRGNRSVPEEPHHQGHDVLNNRHNR